MSTDAILVKSSKRKNKSRYFAGCVTAHKIVFSIIEDTGERNKVLALASSPLTALDADSIRSTVTEVLKQLDYCKEPIAFILPTVFATCRYLKIPATDEKEIGKIAKLQAKRLLPAMGEMITGFQVLGTANGLSDVIMTIVPAAVVDQYSGVLESFEPDSIAIVVHSSACFNFFKTKGFLPHEPVYLLEIRDDRIECSITSDKGISVSRSFTFTAHPEDKKQLFASELRRVNETYLKETNGNLPSRMLVWGPKADYAGTLFPADELGIGVDFIKTTSAFETGNDILDKIIQSDFPLEAAAGACSIPDTLNFVGSNVKLKQLHKEFRKEIIKTGAVVGGAVLIFLTAVTTGIVKRFTRLNELTREINLIETEQKGIENVDIRILRPATAGFPSCLDSLYEVARLTPAPILLEGFLYDAGEESILIKGGSEKSEDIFSFLSVLEKSALLKSLELKVSYLTAFSRGNDRGVAFEISCSRRKR